MDLPKAENTLLLAVYELARKGQPATPETVDGILRQWGEATGGAADDLLGLVGKEALTRVGDDYFLTATGRARAKQLTAREISAWMLASERSQAYWKLCARVYGTGLCQFDMMTNAQLRKLLEVLNLKAGHQALDLGCGIGTVTEYVSDLTGASLTGVDFAAGAIRRAQERTRDKRHRLAFEEADMDELPFPSGSFDAIIAIDSLYFAEDLRKSALKLKEILRPGGQMAILHTTRVAEEASEARSGTAEPGERRLPEVLMECGLRFRAWDFTEDEHELWRNTLQAAEALRAEFEAEGSLDLYRSRISEAERELEHSAAGRKHRCLYLVQGQTGERAASC